MRLAHRWVIVLFLCAGNGFAQQSATSKASDVANEKQATTGTVTGHVYLDDTRKPAHKAMVSLQPVAALQADAPNDHGRGQADSGVTISVETNFDGSFFFSHIAAGTYYVIALSPGYVSPYLALSLAEARSAYGSSQPLGPSQEAAKEAVLKSIPQVNVGSDQPVTVDVTLQHGGAISGNISYDDGSPAAGLEVEALSRVMRDGKETWDTFFQRAPNQPIMQIQTNDRGDYRISGLPAGKYMLRATISASQTITYTSSHGSSGSGTSHGNDLTIYAGSTPHLQHAAAFSIELGEERTGEDIQIPVSKFHTITGYIVSALDGHVINSGQVYLNPNDGKSVSAYADSTVDDPKFTLNFVYDGEYTLTSPMAADVEYELLPQPPGSGVSVPQYNSHMRHLYGAASMPLHVNGNMDGVTIAVPEPTAKQAQAFKDAIEQEEQRNQSPPASVTPK
jgi:hypothetical protein